MEARFTFNLFAILSFVSWGAGHAQHMLVPDLTPAQANVWPSHVAEVVTILLQTSVFAMPMALGT